MFRPTGHEIAFHLSLGVPSSWQAVTNGAVEQVDSTSVARRKRISFRETEPLSTYLFSFVAGKLTRETYSRDGRNISICIVRPTRRK
ncbi:MAG: hypothetical protein ACLR6J_16040 [Parabacteroides merdae]